MSPERRLLLDLLPWARAESERTENKVRIISPLARSQLAMMTEENLEGIRIYPAPKGGWHADLHFRNMPIGRPDAWGTPVQSPVATRAGAERAAKALLVTALMAMRMPQGEDPGPVFELYGWTYPLREDMLEWATATRPTKYTPAYVRDRITEVLDEICPGGHEAELESFNDWPTKRKAALLSILHIAAISGISRYPILEDGPC